MKINVNVTQEIIDGGEHMAMCHCPIANSINRMPEEGDWIEMASVHHHDGHCTLVKKTGETKRILCNFVLPTIARNFIQVWDANKTVQPIEFELELVEQGERDRGPMSTR